MKWRAPASTRERSCNVEPFQMVELPRACKEEHDKYNTKWAGKGLCQEQSFSLNPRTSLRMIGMMLSRKFPPNHHPHSLSCCRPAHSSSARSRVHLECNIPAVCNTRCRARRCRESGKRYVWDVINRSSCSSLLVHNSMHVKCCKPIKTIQPQPHKPLTWLL